MKKLLGFRRGFRGKGDGRRRSGSEDEQFLRGLSELSTGRVFASEVGKLKRAFEEVARNCDTSICWASIR